MEAASIIAMCRARTGLSQRELAERSGTSAAAICLYESGRREPRVETLRRIVEAVGAQLELGVTWPTPAIDVARNARVLEDLLDLGDHLPYRPGERLEAPVLRDLAA